MPLEDKDHLQLHRCAWADGELPWERWAGTWLRTQASGWRNGKVIQLLSHVWFFATPRTAACQASLSFTVPHSLLKLVSIELVISSNHLILCHPFSSCLLSFPASGSFPRSQIFELGSQSIGTSASATILPMNIQDFL